MNDFLQREFNDALTHSQNLHLSNVSRSFLPVFVRMAKAEPSKCEPAIHLIVHTMSVHRSNLVSGLFMLASLAEIDKDTAALVLNKLTSDGISYYCGDADRAVADNASILHAIVFSGKKLSDFPSDTRTTNRNITIIGSNNSVQNGDHNFLQK